MGPGSESSFHVACGAGNKKRHEVWLVRDLTRKEWSDWTLDWRRSALQKKISSPGHSKVKVPRYFFAPRSTDRAPST